MSGASELKVGDPAPDFTLPNQDGRPLRLGDHRGRRVLVWFFPRAFGAG